MCSYGKHALTRNLKEESPVPYVRELEKEMLEKSMDWELGQEVWAEQ